MPTASDDFAKLTAPGEGVKWTPLVESQHEASVAIPGWLLRIPPSDWPEFCQWLIGVAQQASDDPERMAYSVG